MTNANKGELNRAAFMGFDPKAKPTQVPIQRPQLPRKSLSLGGDGPQTGDVERGEEPCMQITCPLFTQVGFSMKHQPPGHATIASRPWWDPVRGGQTGKRGEVSCAGTLLCAQPLHPPPPRTSLCQPTHEKQTQHPASHLQTV